MLRDRLGIEAVLDGCSPQGQCGCCTVLVDDAPRVACVTPARRVAGRQVTTAAGLSPGEQQRWSGAFLACGATQCGFCTPGIVCRLVGHERRGADLSDRATVDRALAAHLCRCTGWQTIREAAAHAASPPAETHERDPEAAARRASIETGGPQRSVPVSVLGAFDFGADGAPPGTLTAVAGPNGLIHAESLTEARRQAGKVQGRRTTLEPVPPIQIPEPPAGTQWDIRLATCWTEPGYLETDAAWCEPGAQNRPTRWQTEAPSAARSHPRSATRPRQLANDLGHPVRVLWSREDTVRRGPKRPPLAAGLHTDGTGIIRIARTPGATEVLQSVLPNAEIVEVDLPGPPTSMDLRAAVWAEAQMLATALNRLQSGKWLNAGTTTVEITSSEGALAQATVGPAGIEVQVDAGDPLDMTTLRSYAIGASHMAWSWVTSEALAVDADGEVHDLTIRSFRIARSADTPHIQVTIEPSQRPPVPAGDAVFAAVAAATWLNRGAPAHLPTG